MANVNPSSSGIWAAVPVKDIVNAKQRLSPILSPDERQGLFRAMFSDVLAALSATTGLGGIMVVTRDPEATELATAAGARVLKETANRGHTAAVESAARQLVADGCDGMLTIPADLPLITAAEIGCVLKAHAAVAATPAAMTIVPARDQLGSNAIACSPPDWMQFRFGDNSFLPHLAAARARGIEPQILMLPGVALDIDRPDDLLAFLHQPSATRTYSYLQQHGIGQRVLAASQRQA